MDSLGDKVSSFTGEALGEVRRKWADRMGGNRGQQRANATPPPATSQATSSAIISDHSQYLASTLSSGIQFGGDTHFSRRSAFHQTMPAIGFRTDLLLAEATNSSGQQYSAQQPTPPPLSSSSSHLQTAQLDISSESLYQGDTWSRLWFQRVMILCLIRLLLFIRKVYEDFQATKVYNLTGQRGHFLIAATTLFMPTIMFTLYRVARYLQLSLYLMRTREALQVPQLGNETNKMVKQTPRTQNNDEESQLRRALMSSPDQSAGIATPTQNEDEGLVTARQTPVNMDEFHDSKSQPGSLADAAPSSPPPRPPPGRAVELESRQTEVKLESVNVDKMGDLPDRDTVRLAIGASEQLLHGVLFIFWQLKRQVDVMGYLVERACLWRKPAEREKEQLNRMNCHRDGLEWFQDFYAAFLAILAQVYTLSLHWSSNPTEADHVRQLSPTQLNAATSGLSSSDAAGAAGDSQSARIVSSLLGLQATLAGKDVLIMSELIVSSAVVFSLLICVRRRDDGPLTLGLSMLGWGSLFAARIIIIALAFVHLGWTLMLPLVVVHVLAITGWIYSIALDSHNGKASELGDEAKWDEEAALEQQHQKAVDGLEMEPSPSPAPAGNLSNGNQIQSQTPSSPTSSWSAMEHVVLILQILGLFAIPSLFYWPIMFNLKLHLRPFKYLVLVLTQNFLLIPAVWFTIVASAEATPGQLYLLGTVGVFSILGFIFVSLYVACKPSLTEYFARADELFNEAEKSGIYFEFCSRVFRMPDLSRTTFRRLMHQTELLEDVDDLDEVDTSSNQVKNTQLASNKTI